MLWLCSFACSLCVRFLGGSGEVLGEVLGEVPGEVTGKVPGKRLGRSPDSAKISLSGFHSC